MPLPCAAAGIWSGIVRPGVVDDVKTVSWTGLSNDGCGWSRGRTRARAEREDGRLSSLGLPVLLQPPSGVANLEMMCMCLVEREHHGAWGVSLQKLSPVPGFQKPTWAQLETSWRG